MSKESLVSSNFD